MLADSSEVAAATTNLTGRLRRQQDEGAAVTPTEALVLRLNSQYPDVGAARPAPQALAPLPYRRSYFLLLKLHASIEVVPGCTLLLRSFLHPLHHYLATATEGVERRAARPSLGAARRRPHQLGRTPLRHHRPPPLTGSGCRSDSICPPSAHHHSSTVALVLWAPPSLLLHSMCCAQALSTEWGGPKARNGCVKLCETQRAYTCLTWEKWILQRRWTMVA